MDALNGLPLPVTLLEEPRVTDVSMLERAYLTGLSAAVLDVATG